MKQTLDWAHPLVRSWFIRKFGSPSEPQIQGWPAILAGECTLISAPTGSGKTLAAFLTCIDGLIRQAINGDLTQTTTVLYVSPLKALSNDIHKNLTLPLLEMIQLAKDCNSPISQEIKVAVRTGDTLPRERQAMLKHPPHILVTTPESLYILLTAQKSRVMLQSIQTIIIDEIHAIANDKRGAHLLLSLERLEALCLEAGSQPPIRIGLSATQKPIELIAKFMNGAKRPLPTIIQIGHQRKLDLKIEVPNSELTAVATNEMWDEIYDRLAALAQQHQSTLIFVNTRRLAERIAHHLSERLGEDQVAAHHGSLSRKIRFAAENKLKNGELKALVATGSLELGIDIGAIDLVCQIGSPRAIYAALQRIGRAGHTRNAISKGRFFATTRDELLECSALIFAIKSGDLDRLIIPQQPLDILAQQIVAACATTDWREDDLFELVCNAYSYAQLSRATFDAVIAMLAEGIAASRGRYGTYLFRDRVNGLVKARRGARFTAIISGGAIPENGLFTVIAEPQEVMVGTLDEDFAIESNRGDIILLGTTSWKVIRVESATGKVRVVDAKGAPPSVPFWRGDAKSRTQELSVQVSNLREEIIKQANNQSKLLSYLQDDCGLDEMGAKQLIEYVQQGCAILGGVPTQEKIIAERFFDEGGGQQLVLHAPFGARINKAWGLALRKCFCRSFNFELQAAATDDGLNISLAEQHSFPLADVFHFLHTNSIKKVLIQAVLQSPLFNTRWRWVATRSLALPRFRSGKKIPPNILRMLADDLLAATFPDAAACQDNLGGRDIELPDHPLIDETMKDILTDALDVDGLIELLSRIEQGKIKCVAIDTPAPSPFAHEILNANPYAFLDDAPLEERRARAVQLRRVLPQQVLQEIGGLNQDAILEVKQEVWPDIRNADELHDTLQTFVALPPQKEWEAYFTELNKHNRVGIAKVTSEQKLLWFAHERAKTFATIYEDAIDHQEYQQFDENSLTRDEAIVTMLRGWLQHLGPTTAQELSEILSVPIREIEQALLKIETTGLILRGQFSEKKNHQAIEWCERRLLARIHRYTLGRLRQEIKPVTSAQFVEWLLKWQHLAPGTSLRGEQGLLEVLKQLQGFEMPANAWEKQILSKRVIDYDQTMLDQLCLTGVIGWGRISSLLDTTFERKKRIMPTSVAPITFFIREEADWLAKEVVLAEHEENLTGLSTTAKKIYHYLQQHGASFFNVMVPALNLLKAEVETGLWELVAAGKVTADSFDNLRALIEPKRRLKQRTRKQTFRFSAYRWSLLKEARQKTVDSDKHAEAICWMLLKRYGVVFRDLVSREKNILRWRELLVAFRRLEDRGEIRGGRFVSGFLGEQFALPYAVDSLRAMRKASVAMQEKHERDSYPSDQTKESASITISAVDPINLVGIIVPGKRVSAHSRNTVTIPVTQSIITN